MQGEQNPDSALDIDDFADMAIDHNKLCSLPIASIDEGIGEVTKGQAHKAARLHGCGVHTDDAVVCIANGRERRTHDGVEGAGQHEAVRERVKVRESTQESGARRGGTQRDAAGEKLAQQAGEARRERHTGRKVAKQGGEQEADEGSDGRHVTLRGSHIQRVTRCGVGGKALSNYAMGSSTVTSAVA